MILERRLNWAAPTDDVPAAIEGEVGGPGDDFRIEFGTRRAPLEIQCKRTLAGKVAVASAISDIASRLSAVPREHEFVLVAGSASTTEVRDVFATDVRNFRQGRRHSLRRITQSVLADVAKSEEIFSRLYVVPLDVDVDSGPAVQVALDGLRQVLTEPNRAEEAWAILVRNGLRLAQRGRWDRSSIVGLLGSHGFNLRPVGPDARWLEQIDYARNLNSKWRSKTAAGVLDHLASEIQGQAIQADVRRQLHAVRGASALALGDLQKARENFGRALEYVVAPSPGAAPLPLAQVKPWLDARYNYAVVLRLHGDDEAAERIAREILALDAHHVFAWSLLALSLDTRDAAVEPPPAELAETPDYRDALAEIATRRGDWRSAADVVTPLLAAGQRNPWRLVGYAQALINIAAESPSDVEKTRILETAERTSDEAVRLLENSEVDQQLARALFARGRAREALGRESDSIEDYERAAVLAPTDVNVVMRAVHARRAEGDLNGALAFLTDDAVESSALLRVIRAEVLSQLGVSDAAVADVMRALDELPAAATRANLGCYLGAGAVALELQRADLAERSVAALDAGGFADDGPEPGILRARIAATRGHWEAAEAEYRAAASRTDFHDAARILNELATQLSVADLHERAIPIYEEAGSADPREPIFHNFIGSLMRARQFERVASLTIKLEGLAQERGETAAALPTTLLNAAINIASRQEDFSTAARLLDTRLAQEELAGKAPPADLALSAAQAHANAGDIDRSASLVDEILTRDDLSPEQRMWAANVLVAIGRYQRAINVAFVAVRAQPSDKRMIGNFISVVLSPDVRRAGKPQNSSTPNDAELETPDIVSTDDGDISLQPEGDDEDDDIGAEGRRGVVTKDSFVRVKTEDGQRYDYFIYQDAPADNRLGEFLMSDTAVADLVGKRVGDVVVRNRGTWNEQRLRVTRVMPAVVIVFRRYLRTFAAQFPDEGMFRIFHVGKKPTLDSLGPVLATAHAGAAHTDELLSKYDETPLPLGMLAQALNKPLIDLTVYLAADPARRLHTDGPPYTNYSDSIAAASAAITIVLTRPALAFIEGLGLWDTFRARYRLVAPQSMMDEWDAELRELETTTEDGRIFFRERSARPAIEVIPAGAAEALLQASRSLYDRVRTSAIVLHRPASALSPADDEWRDLLGAPSFDAIALARELHAALYADDLALRAIAAREYGAQSFPTSALVDALHADGRIATDAFEHAIVRLIEWGHEMVPMRASTIVAAFGRAGTSMRTAERVLARLADPRVTATSAAVVSVGALRGLATAGIATTRLDVAAERVADVLVREREPGEVIPIFVTLLRQAFRLLPREREAIEAAVKRTLSEKRILRSE
jgi:tetratricopeptide (TPR) repeat protein